MRTDIAPLDIEPAADPEGGLGALATSRGNLPLDAVDVRADICGLAASVELTQGFRNPFDVPLEATYIFPLPDRAAVTAMRMEAAGHVVEGVLKERSQARADYDEAIAQGRRAAIAEEDRPDVFTMRVGNIAPGERVTVRLTLAQPLPYQDGEVTFRFPLVVAPRYIPGSPLGGAPAGGGVAADTDAVPDASRITPPVLLPGFPNPVQLTLRAEIDPAGLPLAGIRCSLHATAEDAEDAEETQASAASTLTRTIVRLKPGERLDRDFILRLAIAGHEQLATSLILTQDPGEGPAQGTFSLMILPPDSPAQARPRDVVLVLDRSGSMGGWKMVAARRAAARIVDTLTDADRFAVLCFDNAVERVPDLSSGLAQASDRNRFRAIEQLARTDARGGTEMLRPLEAAVRLLTDAMELTGATEPEVASTARDRVLVLVTDGQVGNEDQILNRIGPALGRIRVHVVGIDQAVNAGFLSRLASAGRGRCELVESEDRLDEAAARIHRRIGAPLVTALTLTAADGLRIEPATVAPSLLPDLFPGVPMTVAGRWQGQAGGTLTVRGASADGTPFESDVVAAVGGTPANTASWARAHLRDLEDRYASLAGHEAGELARLEQRITDVSLRYGVLCRFTAFVATDTRVVTDGAAPHRVTQPVELPAGWDMDVTAQGLAAGAARAFAAPPPSAAAELSHMTGARASSKMSKMSPAKPMRAPRAPAPSPMGYHAASGHAKLSARHPSRADNEGRLLMARDQLAGEVTALRLAKDAPDTERLRFLADLATRLEALLSWLAGGDTGELIALAELIVRLRTCDAPGAPRGADLDALWNDTTRLLAEFTRPRPGRGRREFWKRPR